VSQICTGPSLGSWPAVLAPIRFLFGSVTETTSEIVSFSVPDLIRRSCKMK